MEIMAGIALASDAGESPKTSLSIQVPVRPEQVQVLRWPDQNWRVPLSARGLNGKCSPARQLPDAFRAMKDETGRPGSRL
uniref:Uncharacterized protein n=1 Tax=Aquisalinus luteolus TaxID=1566827 RepID=A0A8J3A8N3_9PROT|nr:hypothetical protein GCM10011355_27500 [Aquisalinus luteolus]